MQFIRYSNDGDCAFYLENNHFYKVCCKLDKVVQYEKAFSLERHHMNHLYNAIGEKLYTSFFPRYNNTPNKRFFFKGTDTPCPFICMTFIQGESLEDYLSTHPTNQPTFILSSKHLSTLLKQLKKALNYLNQANILYFDLNPSNIIITDSTQFHIQLIDFTGCYYTDQSFYENYRRGYKKVDNRTTSILPLSLCLLNSSMCLFTRLFYSGNISYNTYFFRNNHNVQRFFHSEFGNTLDFFLNQNIQPLDAIIADANFIESNYNNPERYLQFFNLWINNIQRFL